MELLTELLPHQREAVDKLGHLKVGALFCEQGTGKTRITLSLIRDRMVRGKVDCALWLCPCSVKKNLREDIIYHCGEMPENLIIRGIESLSSSDRLYMMLLELVNTHRVFLVVDESTLVKNNRAVRTERIVELSKIAPYRLILNGTPISRNEADLFSQFYILDWRILGYKSWYSFAANHLEYWTVRMPNGDERIDRSRIKRVLNTDYLAEKIEPYTFQVRKSDCLDLPRKVHRERSFSMTDDQRKIYEAVKDIYLMSVEEIKNDTIYKYFSALQHVTAGRNVLSPPERRMRTEPIFADPMDNPRVEALLKEVELLEGEKCIVFCKYQSEIDTLLSLLPNAVEFSGRLSQKKRQESRRQFREESQFLISNKACGAYGLNLQFCHHIIFYNNDFSLATRLQAEDRVHRIGQTHDVEIVDICAENSIDRFIADCLIKKENLAEAFKKELAWKKDTLT